MKQYIDILDDRVEEVIIGGLGLIKRMKKRSVRLPKNSVFCTAMYLGMRNGR